VVDFVNFPLSKKLKFPYRPWVITFIAAVALFEATPLNAQIFGDSSSVIGLQSMRNRVSIGSSVVSHFRRYSTSQNTLNTSIRSFNSPSRNFLTHSGAQLTTLARPANNLSLSTRINSRITPPAILARTPHPFTHTGRGIFNRAPTARTSILQRSSGLLSQMRSRTNLLSRPGSLYGNSLLGTRRPLGSSSSLANRTSLSNRTTPISRTSSTYRSRLGRR